MLMRLSRNKVGQVSSLPMAGLDNQDGCPTLGGCLPDLRFSVMSYAGRVLRMVEVGQT